MDKEIIYAVIGLIALCYGAVQLSEASCLAKAVSFEDARHSFLGGCMVKHQGKWLPLENIRGFD